MKKNRTIWDAPPIGRPAYQQEFLHSEKSKQGTSPEPLVSDDTQLGTGCSSFASGATEDEGLDAAPLGHKIEDENECPVCHGEGFLMDEPNKPPCMECMGWR